jgi:hypothetical protein
MAAGKPKCIIAPSLLSGDFARLEDEAKRMLAIGADWLHMDVMVRGRVGRVGRGRVRVGRARGFRLRAAPRSAARRSRRRHATRRTATLCPT